MNPFRRKILRILAFVILILGLGSQGICGPPLPLEPETLFCLYYKMSGESMRDQDVEDLCSALGRPTYSAFKPSELFSKKSLKAVKKRLKEKMGRIDQTTSFSWDMACQAVPLDSRGTSLTLRPVNDQMPDATFLIRAEISGKGQRDLVKALNRLSSAIPNLKRGMLLQVTVQLVPEGVSDQLQIRNIAREEVRVPVRCLFLKPFKVEVAGNT